MARRLTRAALAYYLPPLFCCRSVRTLLCLILPYPSLSTPCLSTSSLFCPSSRRHHLPLSSLHSRTLLQIFPNLRTLETLPLLYPQRLLHSHVFLHFTLTDSSHHTSPALLQQLLLLREKLTHYLLVCTP